MSKPFFYLKTEITKQSPDKDNEVIMDFAVLTINKITDVHETVVTGTISSDMSLKLKMIDNFEISSLTDLETIFSLLKNLQPLIQIRKGNFFKTIYPKIEV